jgi:hypothetical protein
MKTRTSLILSTFTLAFLTLGAMQAQAFIVNWRPVGITFGQTARVTLANTGEIRGFIINWRFLDSDGVVIAQSERPLTVPFGKMVSVDLNRDALSRTDARVQIRAEVEVLTPGNTDKTLSTSFEVFDNADGKTTVFFPTETI